MKQNDRLAAQQRRKEALLPQVTQLALEGVSRREIGKTLGLRADTVSRWLKGLRREHASQAGADTVKIIANIVKRYESIYREAMKQWRRSQEEKQVRMIEESGGGGGDGRAKKKKAIRTEVRTGNAAFLGKAMDALKAIREIKGIDAPRRTEIAGPSGGPIELTAIEDDDLRNMTNEQLAAFRREIRARIREQELRDADAPGVHKVHQARLPHELAPRETGGDAGPGGDGALPAADGH